MRPLRFVALSADGQAMILTDEVGRMLSLAIDDQVIAAVQREGTGPPGQLSMDVEATLTPRDIQSRIRSGESAEHVARLANVPMEKVLRFAGPVLQERAAMAQLARRTRLRGADSSQTLADVVDSRLRAHGVDVETVAWDSHRRDDGGWRTTATWPSGKATAHAIWDLDRARSMVTPIDEMANFLSSEVQDLLIGPDGQGAMFGHFADDADLKEGPVVPALSMLRRRDDRRRDDQQVPAAPTREMPRELPRELPRETAGRGRTLDPRFDEFRRAAEARREEPTGDGMRPVGDGVRPAAASRLDPTASRPASGAPETGSPAFGPSIFGTPTSRGRDSGPGERPGVLGAGHPGSGPPDRNPAASGLPLPNSPAPHSGLPSHGGPSHGGPSHGAPGTNVPGPQVPGPNVPGPQVPGVGLPGSGASRANVPGGNPPGSGSPTTGGRGASWLDQPRSAPNRREAEDVRRPDPWGDDPRRPAGRRGDVLLPGRPTSGPPAASPDQSAAPSGGVAGRNDWRERLDPTGVGTPPAPSPPATPPTKGSRARRAELPSWDDILFGSGSGRRGT